jgi:hypothetical protein
VYKFNNIVYDKRFTPVYPPKQVPSKFMVDNLLNHFKNSIEKIIIFGSCITLRCGLESDIDLCIISNDLTVHNLDIAQIPHPDAFDILIVKPEEFNQDCGINSVYTRIKEEGYIIYERPVFINNV